MDLTGPISMSKRGNDHILVVKDALTRYVITIPMKGKEAETIATALVMHVICIHGAFGHLITDNGKEFDNKRMAQITDLLQLKHTTITQENPRANGLAENHMRVLKDSLSIYSNETQDDWDDFLPGVNLAYNTTVNSQTGFTPFFMMFGREAILPSENWMKTFREISSTEDYIKKLVTSLTHVWEKAALNKPKEIKRMTDAQEKYRRHLQYVEYKVGDYAMVSKTPKQSMRSWIDKTKRKLSAKLQPRYSGPYLITGRRSPVVFLLQIDGREKITHAVNMKPFSGKLMYTTPFVQRGFNKDEAAQTEAPDPLLLSDDPVLNEAARTGYEKKYTAAQAEQTRRDNRKQIRTERKLEMDKLYEESQTNESSWLLDDYEEPNKNDSSNEYQSWLREKARRRIIILNSLQQDFASKSQQEQEIELDKLDAAGYSMEDMVDMELARQEIDWQQSLSESFEIQPTQMTKPTSIVTKKTTPKKPRVSNTIITRAKARRC
jgi:hypothetical protein